MVPASGSYSSVLVSKLIRILFKENPRDLFVQPIEPPSKL